MDIIYSLKEIVPAHIGNKYPQYQIKLSTSQTNANSYNIDTGKKTITIFVNNLSPKESRILSKVIKSNFELGKLCLIEESKIPLLEKLYSYDDKDDNKILEFFKKILSTSDWSALRDSLFLRKEFKSHKGVDGLKGDIISRYGERGNIISNLCTAGYFEGVMMPLYNNSQKEFWEYYGNTLDRGITAFFVNSKMTEDFVRKEMSRRVEAAKKYGIYSIDIHGIGKANISKIKACIKSEDGKIKFKEKHIQLDKHLNVLVVEIILK